MAPAAPQRSWRELLGAPQQQQQQQSQGHAQQQERQAVAAAAAAAATQADEEAVAVNPNYVCPDKADRLMGWTEGNLPQVLQKRADRINQSLINQCCICSHHCYIWTEGQQLWAADVEKR
jgi:hypothetical protein